MKRSGMILAAGGTAVAVVAVAAAVILLGNGASGGSDGRVRSAASTPLPPGSPAPTSLAARPVPGSPGTSYEPWPEGSDSSARAADFVGSETCGECHRHEYDLWKGSTHGTAGSAHPSPATVVAPFDGTPLQFADATVIPRRTSDGHYEFVVRRPGHSERRLRVDAVVGKGHMVGGGTQGSLEHLPDGTWRLLPFDFSVTAGRWFCNTEGRDGRGWVPVGPGLRLEACMDWTPRRVLGTIDRYTNCQECHGSQIHVTVRRGAPHFDTRFTSLRVNCESCHGPGRKHVELARSGKIPGRKDIGIASRVGMSRDASLGLCFQCHAFKDALRPGYLPGRRLEAHFSLLSPQLGESPLYPDGRVRSFAYQLNHISSDCYLGGGMTCVDCHDPHSQKYRDVWGAALHGRFDDQQCTDCHAAKAAHPERHTHHPAGSPGSRCIACHMPYLQEAEIGTAIPYGRSDHTIPIPRPVADSAMGVEPACQKCHRDRSVRQLQADEDRWWGRIKPRRPDVAILFAADTASGPHATISLLHPAAGDPLARYAGLARLVEDHIVPGVPTRPAVRDDLERMARTGDLDLRALALAALDITAGGDSSSRAGLERMAGSDPLVWSEISARWAQAIGWMADRYRNQGKLDTAEVLYRRAIQVDPGDADLHIGLGYAYTAAGAPEDALREYRLARRLRPDDALLVVNTGIALLRLGRADQATAAYREAIQIDPAEPLAHFNLGNAYLRAGDATRAAAEYTKTIELDASLAPAHFNLARALISERRYRPALQALRDGLAYDSTDAGARELARRLARALGGS